MAYMKPVAGLCDRCAQRYPLRKLKFEYVLGRNTGLRVCPKCIDPSHPQLDTRNVKTSDKQSVPNSRSDRIEWAEERYLWAWAPVGQEMTSTITTAVGRVTVTT